MISMELLRQEIRNAVAAAGLTGTWLMQDDITDAMGLDNIRVEKRFRMAMDDVIRENRQMAQ